MTHDFLTISLDDAMARAALERTGRWFASAPDAAKTTAIAMLDALCGIAQGVADTATAAPAELDSAIAATRERLARVIAPAAWADGRGDAYARARRVDSLCAGDRVLDELVRMGMEAGAEEFEEERAAALATAPADAAEPREDSRDNPGKGLTTHEIQILREIAGELPKSPWGAWIAACLETLRDRDLINKNYSGVTAKGRAALEADALQRPPQAREDERAP